MSDSNEKKTGSDLSSAFLEVVERAAIACARTMGQGDRHGSDQVAVEAMRETLDKVPIDGRVVIGEGERDEAPMLYIGERVGLAHAAAGGTVGPLVEIDIAVDPLEGTNLCATGSPNAIAVLAAVAPDLEFEEALVGGCAIDAEGAPVSDATVARALDCGLVLLGAVGGPLAVGALMETFGPWAFFGFVLAMFAAIAVYAAWRMTRRPAVAKVKKGINVKRSVIVSVPLFESCFFVQEQEEVMMRSRQQFL